MCENAWSHFMRQVVWFCSFRLVSMTRFLNIFLRFMWTLEVVVITARRQLCVNCVVVVLLVWHRVSLSVCLSVRLSVRTRFLWSIPFHRSPPVFALTTALQLTLSILYGFSEAATSTCCTLISHHSHKLTIHAATETHSSIAGIYKTHFAYSGTSLGFGLLNAVCYIL